MILKNLLDIYVPVFFYQIIKYSWSFLIVEFMHKIQMLV